MECCICCAFLLEAIRDRFNENLLKHISPLGWKYINFLGEYVLMPKDFPV